MKPCILPIFILFFFITGCFKEDKTSELLLGRWELQEAFRQNKQTSTLDGLYFEFSRDTLYSNNIFFGINPFEYSRDTLKVLSADPYRFEVFSLDSVHLDLRGEIKDVLFHLQFKKVAP